MTSRTTPPSPSGAAPRKFRPPPPPLYPCPRRSSRSALRPLGVQRMILPLLLGEHRHLHVPVDVQVRASRLLHIRRRDSRIRLRQVEERLQVLAVLVTAGDLGDEPVVLLAVGFEVPPQGLPCIVQ